MLKSLIERLSTTKYSNDATCIWAQSKLKKYEMLQEEPKSFKPFRGKEITSKISYEDLVSLIKLRRSNRAFKEQLVTEDIIIKLKEVVNWAASSCNKQPIQLFVVKEEQDLVILFRRFGLLLQIVVDMCGLRRCIYLLLM